jgi:hypothetical protein
MKLFQSLAVVIALTAPALMLTSAEAATNLVQNPGFETGDFSDWTQSGNLGATYVGTTSAYAHSGTYGAQLGPVGSDGYLSQTIASGPGVYDVSFWFNQHNGPTNDFSVTFSGQTLLSLTNYEPSPANTWVEYSYTVTSSLASQQLTFAFRQDPGYQGLDDISVIKTGVPETSTWAMMLIGFAGLGFAGARRAKRSAQNLGA